MAGLRDTDRERDQVAPGRLVSGDAKPAGRKAAPGRTTLTSELEDGAALPSPLRTKFERSLGHDLSAVRVHTGEAAHQLAGEHGARAFAVGNDIYFRQGQYNPGTREGDHLIAHEVAHTVQQRGGMAVLGGKPAPTKDLATTTPGDRAESNADSVAAAMIAGTPATVSSESVAIARKGENESIDVPAEAPAGKDGKDGKAEDVSLTAEFVSAQELPGTEPVAAPHDLDHNLAELKGKGDAKGDAKDADAHATGDAASDAKTDKKPAGGGDAGGAEVSPELTAAIAGAQNDAKEASAAAETEGNQFKAELAAKRDRFQAEQEALAHEQLKTMSPADKRRTLVEMGMPENDVKKLKDAELDALIEGRLATENRKTQIMGMTPEELAALPPARKIQHLVDLGIDKGDLDKIGQDKACRAFDDIMRVAHVPGQHEVKIKIKGGLFGKSWVVSVKCDAQGNTDIQAKKEGGFFSKLWGWIKLALPIILTVLAPVTGGASLIALAIYQTVVAIKTGNWLGAIVGIAGAFIGLGAIAAIKNGASSLAQGLTKVADVASKVKTAAQTAQAAMLAAKAKNAGSLLGALASGAATFAKWAGDAAGKFATTMTSWSERLKKWAGVISGAEKVVQGVKTGDPVGAIGGAFESVSAATSKTDANSKQTSGTSAALQLAATVSGFVATGRKALQAKPPDYFSVAEAALGIAGQLKDDKRIEDAGRITAAANRVKAAWEQRDSNPALLAQAALDLAQAIQVAKYDFDHGGEVKKDENADQDRTAIMDRYVKANAIAKAAADIIRAASAKPRPDYVGALAAATEMIADLTENKQIDAAAVVTAKLDAWTAAINSKDENRILQAGIALGESINGIRKVIEDERAKAKKEAEAKLEAGDKLPEVAVTDIPHFETTVDVVGTAPQAPLDAAQLATDIALPEATPETPQTPLSGRASTPGANYTVIAGDTLSGIAQRFKTTVAKLRQLNAQLVNDRIYIGQRIDVPGADVLLTPSVTTEETYSIDPGVLAAAGREQLVRTATTFIKTMQDRIKAWRGENSLGADFYVYVRELDDLVTSFERTLANPNTSESTIRSTISTINTRSQGVQRLYDMRRGQKDFLIDVGLTVLPIVKDGCGLLISALATPAAAAGYAAVISSIESYFAGDGLGVGAAKAAGAAIFESYAPLKSGAAAKEVEKFLKGSFNQAFQNCGSALTDYFKALQANPKMTAQEKRDAKARLVARIGVSIATSPLKGALDAQGIEVDVNGAVFSNFEGKLLNMITETIDKTVELTLGPG